MEATGKARGRASAAKAWQRALELTAPIASRPRRTLPAVVRECAVQFGDAPALLSERQSLSYRELDSRADRYARWVLAHGVGRSEAVGLLMPNSPEYLAAWLGMTRAGVAVALLNTQLRGASLAHCVRAAGCRLVVVDATLADRLAEALHEAGLAVQPWVYGPAPAGHRRIDIELEGIGEGRPDESAAPTIDDRALLIYTSGTTGLPKAANISHARLMQWSLWFAGMMDAGPEDRMYNVLPLYHSVGGVLATGALLVSGGSVVIRDGFSASRFWGDIARWQCTMFQYIGELCRYLLRAPPSAEERQHALRICCGNGLRGDIWQAFAERFRIPRIFEFYAATEGNVSLFNVEGKPGAIGRIPAYLAHRFPVALVRLDREAARPLRNAEGFCERCAVDEPGEALGRIETGSSNVGARFEGYTSSEATEAKILRDVFAHGDAWFRTGDLMRRDAEGYFTFVERIGETFRWKGENVSTEEVAQALLAYPGVDDAVVYGVAVPGADGRAGMAALTCSPALDLAGLRAHLESRLPPYARPLFLRLCGAVPVTGTFKHARQQLAKQAYEPRACGGDALYLDDRQRGAYVRLDDASYQRIQDAGSRL
jgi:fatty-acyl-CoA synthase